MSSVVAGEFITTVNGTEAPAPTSLRVRHEVPTELSLPWTHSAGITAAQADVTWGAPSGLTAAVDHPWLPGWPQAPGAPVTVDVEGLRDTPWRLFTGSISRARTDLGAGTSSATCTDATTRLDRPVTIAPVAYKMPQLDLGSTLPTGLLRVGMSSAWVTAEILAQCGFWAHQPQMAGAVLFASNLGSLWPRVGQMLEAWSTSRGTVLSPQARSTTWPGGGMVDAHAWWRADNASTAAPFRLTVDIDTSDPSGSSSLLQIRPSTATPGGFGLRITETALQLVTFTGTMSSPVVTVRATRARTDRMSRVTLTYDGTGFALTTDAGTAPVTYTGTTPVDLSRPSVVLDSTGGALIGAVQLQRTLTPDPLMEPRTARIHRDLWDMTTNGTVGAVPFIDGRNAMTILAEQAKAEFLTLAVTEDGTVISADRGWAESQPVRHVITDATYRGGRPVDLPANRFADPGPTAGAGLTLSGSTLIDYLADLDGPYVRVTAAAAGSALTRTAAYAGAARIPVTPGGAVTITAQNRSLTNTPGQMRVQMYDAAGAPIAAPVDSGISRGGGEWLPLAVTVDVPRAAVTASVTFGNGGSVNQQAETEWRNFSTLGPGALLMGMSTLLDGSQPRSKVMVRAQQAAITVRTLPTVLWAVGKSEVLSRGDEFETFLHAESGTDWIGTPEPPRYAGVGHPVPYDKWLNRSIGTWVGGIRVAISDGAMQGWVTAAQMPTTMTVINPATVLIEGWVDATEVPTGSEVVTQTDPASLSLPEHRMRQPLPEVRGSGIITWADVTTEAGTGPADAQPLVHDGAWWLQTQYRREQVAQEILAYLADPQPLVTGLECALAPVDLLDRVIVHVTSVARLTLDCIVVGRDVDADSHTMSLDVRVTTATVDGLTYGQYRDALATGWTYGDLDAAHAGDTYADLTKG